MPSIQPGEVLLEQLVSRISPLSDDIDQVQLQTTIADVLSRYDIRLARLPNCHPDLREKADMFLAAKRLEGLSEITLDGYAIELRIFAQSVDKPVSDITTADIRGYLGQFDQLKMSSLARKLSILKSFFSWLCAEEIIPRDPAVRIKPPRKEQRLPKALSIEELEMMRESCKTLRDRALVEVFYSTGGRLSELQALNREDINWQDMSARVVGKGNKEREVLFSFKALYHLKKYLMSRLDSDPALFVTERRPYRRVSTRAIQREVALIAQRAGITKSVHPHTLRHTFATLTLNNGADISTVQAILGHEDPSTTQIYAQVTQERKREQYRKHLVQ